MIRYLILVAAIFVTSWGLADEDEDDDGGREHSEKSAGRDLRSLAPVSNATWKAECGSCHMAFHPGLLPERSWAKLMAGLDKHFGENASVDPKPKAEITKFLAGNAADRGATPRSEKIAAAIPTSETPLRITETRWFRAKHHEIGAKIWKRKSVGSAANCAACHRGAEAGRFSEHDVIIPR